MPILFRLFDFQDRFFRFLFDHIGMLKIEKSALTLYSLKVVISQNVYLYSAHLCEWISYYKKNEISN